MNLSDEEVQAVLVDRERSRMLLWHVAATLVESAECRTTVVANCRLKLLAVRVLQEYFADSEATLQQWKLGCAGLECPKEYPQIPLAHCVPAALCSALIVYRCGEPIAAISAQQVDQLACQHATLAKEAGNKSFRNNDHRTALWEYSQAIAISSPGDPSRHVYYSNRSECFLRLGSFARSLADADAALAICPDHAKSIKRRELAMDHM